VYQGLTTYFLSIADDHAPVAVADELALQVVTMMIGDSLTVAENIADGCSLAGIKRPAAECSFTE
jgi:hypothetical protein